MALLALLRSAMRAFGNTGRLVRQQSSLKIAVILFCSLSLFLGLGVIFYEGFRFLHSLGGVGLMIIQRLFALFFFGLAVMLLFSSVVTTYSTMYRADDVPSLLVRPVPLGELVLFKYLESALLSSWAFFFMILPFIGAYAIHEKLSPLFALWTLLYAVPFVLLCSGLGTLVCIALVRWLPSGRALYLLLAGLALVLIAWGWRTSASGPDMNDNAALILTRLIPGIRMSSHPLLPSWWMAEGIMSLARSQWSRGVMLWGLMTSTVLVLGLVIEAAGRRFFFGGWIKATTSPRRKRAVQVGRTWAEKLLVVGARDTRALLLKDIRAFTRDTAQWIQVVVFFGLLAIYFLNLRQLRYHLLGAEWRNLIVFLNLFSVSAVMCSLSSRFVYPQMSLEGHSFWILGLSPLSLGRVVRAKFALACGLLQAVGLALMWLSTHMLNVDWLLRGVTMLAASCICFVVSAFAVGLGSVFLDLKQRNPAAIVSSFGGTLNLVLSMAFTFLVLIPLAAIFHSYALGHLSPPAFHRAVLAAIGFLLPATAICAWLVLRLGVRSLEQREY